MRSKGQWEHAPRWADYRAMDADGLWYWHEYSPDYDNETGKWTSIGAKEPCVDPSNSLEFRPGFSQGD